MTLLEIRGGYLYQVRPDVFPEGYLTGVEIYLWDKYYAQKLAKRNS
jgi:hypothetical protein